MAVQSNSEKEILQQAYEAEAEEDFEQAIKLYKEEIKRHPLKDYAYDRLMIIYRKLKKYKEEMQVVDKGIKVFENYFKKKSDKLTSKHKKLMTLSKALIKSTGLGDRNHEYFPEPLNKWRRRRGVIEKRLKKA